MESPEELPRGFLFWYLRKTMNYHECFAYNSDTGELVWKVRPGSHFNTVAGCNVTNARCAGKVAGSTDAYGYIVVCVFGKIRKAHRIIYEMFNGPISEGYEIDHRNGVRSDNRLPNLRELTQADNHLNRGVNQNSKSGLKGVYWSVKAGKWSSMITHKHKRRYLGVFDTKEAAYAAYLRASEEIYGALCRHHATD